MPCLLDCMHLGCASTSIVGNHHALKVGKLNLQGIHLFVRDLDRKNNERQIEISRGQIVHWFRHLKYVVLKGLLRKISKYALDMIVEQYELVDLSLPPTSCSGKFNKTHGIPCKHHVRRCIESESAILLSDIDIQWHLEMEVKEASVVKNHNPKPRDNDERTNVFPGNSMLVKLREFCAKRMKMY
jgi:hypothetical protein